MIKFKFKSVQNHYSTYFQFLLFPTHVLCTMYVHTRGMNHLIGISDVTEFILSMKKTCVFPNSDVIYVDTFYRLKFETIIRTPTSEGLI